MAVPPIRLIMLTRYVSAGISAIFLAICLNRFGLMNIEIVTAAKTGKSNCAINMVVVMKNM